MRKARYDLRQVVCPNSSCIGYSSNIARPGYWVRVCEDYVNKGFRGEPYFARVLGRIAEVERDGLADCVGWLAVVRLYATSCGVRWVHPSDVQDCYERPPHALMEWLTDPKWVKSKADIARIIAMNEHGTLSEEFIAFRDDPSKPYNLRPEYAEQFILKE